MQPRIFYNEFDAETSDWLRRLVRDGVVPPGDVDSRSIVEIDPEELKGYDQCHFFAGIGTRALALHNAGWPPDRQVWTGSCPCQPFSGAGKGKGFDDDRHLWPVWNALISERRPGVVFGEQVASKDGLEWLDLVQADLEAKDYAVGAFDLCAAGVGAPHIRQRLWLVADLFGSALADTCQQGVERGTVPGRTGREGQEPHAQGRGKTGVVDDASVRHAQDRGLYPRQGKPESPPTDSQRSGEGGYVGIRDAFGEGLEGYSGHVIDRSGWSETGRPTPTPSRDYGLSGREMSVHNLPGPVNGFWADAQWVYCDDDKLRPLKPGITPLADGPAEHVLRVGGYGNGIVEPLAREFISTYMELDRA